MPESREEFLKTNPHLSEFLPFLDNLRDESHRGAVLLSAAYIDELLKRILLGFFRDGKESEDLVGGHNAPLGTFNARTTVCLALGLISDDEHHELNIIRRLRNEFAHSPRASFSDTQIADRCRELKFRIPGEGLPHAHFSSSAVALISGLINRAHYVRQQRRTFLNWPK